MHPSPPAGDPSEQTARSDRERLDGNHPFARIRASPTLIERIEALNEVAGALPETRDGRDNASRSGAAENPDGDAAPGIARSSGRV